LLVVFFLVFRGPRKTIDVKKKEATDAYANWIYITKLTAYLPHDWRRYTTDCVYIHDG